MSYNLLKGKKGIIFGALDENSIAWKTAERAHEEGAEFVLTNAPIAMRMGQIKELAAKTGNHSCGCNIYGRFDQFGRKVDGNFRRKVRLCIAFYWNVGKRT